MTNDGGDDRGPKDDFDARLRAARERFESRSPDRDRSDAERSRWQGIGFAMRVGSELIASLIVGVGIGWLLDEWLGTRPWLMALFFFAGGGAGVMNVYRLVAGQDAAIGWKRPGRDRLDGSRDGRDAGDGDEGDGRG